MIKKSLLSILVLYLFFIVAICFFLLLHVSFTLFSKEWWKYAFESIQAFGSLATAGTLTWVIYDKRQDKKERERDRKESKFYEITKELIQLCDIKTINQNIKIGHLIYRLEKDFFEDIRFIGFDERISPLRAHINQMTNKLSAENLIGMDVLMDPFPIEIYKDKTIDDITVPVFKRRVAEVAFLITQSKSFSISNFGEVEAVKFETSVDKNALNKLIIIAQPICTEYLEKTADICWHQQDLNNIYFIINGIDVAAFIYVLNHENGKALVKSFHRKFH